MSVWNKKIVSKNEVELLQKKYGIDALTASIFIRRNITQGKDILFYLEDDLRFQHSPFCFNEMEDAVDRILEAQEENEKVLIFGDRDVDGVTATTVLYDCLKSMGIDVSFRLPQGDDAYGLSMEAVEDFSKNYGSLIITVDCGISNINEVARASELGIDVIITDHHNPPEELPSPAIILDQKLEDSGYPFKDISGCAVVYKLVSALRYAKSKWYKTEIVLLNIEEQENSYLISCVKVKNSIPVSKLEEKIIPGEKNLEETKLFSYLKNQLIMVWNEKHIKTMLSNIFGNSADFNLMDLKNEFKNLSPSIANSNLSQLKFKSKIAKYGNHEPTEIGGLYNLLVTYISKEIRTEFPEISLLEEKDLQLVALAALADIMPMKNENRIFVKKGLAAINAHKIRPGLLELMTALNLTEKKVTSTDLSWNVVSNLNAAGRMGQSELAAELFLEKNPLERQKIVQKIIELNNLRKDFTQKAVEYSAIQAKASIPEHSNKLAVVIDERINRGVSGILAGKLVALYGVPALAVTFVGENAIGSMRTCRNYNATNFLTNMSDLFISYGGHNAAAGFSFERSKLNEFIERLKKESENIVLDEYSDDYEVDAEIPLQYLTPELLNLSDNFEPYGEQNQQLLFMTRNLLVQDALVFSGKGNDKLHLKMTVNAGKFKWPCIFWSKGDLLHKEFEIGDRIDLLFRIDRNVYNKIETPQIIVVDLKKSENW